MRKAEPLMFSFTQKSQAGKENASFHQDQLVGNFTSITERLKTHQSDQKV